MTESKLTQAQRRYEAASDALNALLEEGADGEKTQKARDVLGAAERELAKAEGNEQERLKKIEAEQVAEAEKLVDELSKEIGATMQRIIASVSTPDAPRIATGAAQAVLKARSEAAQAAEVLSQAKDRLNHLEARHTALSEQWDNITARRAQGDTRETDTAQLVVIAADKEGVGKLVEIAQDEVSRADLHHARAAEALKLAERRWAGQTAEQWRLAMLKTAEPLERAIVQAADEINAHRGWNGEKRKAYAPTDFDFKRTLEAGGYAPARRYAA